MTNKTTKAEYVTFRLNPESGDDERYALSLINKAGKDKKRFLVNVIRKYGIDILKDIPNDRANAASDRLLREIRSEMRNIMEEVCNKMPTYDANLISRMIAPSPHPVEFDDEDSRRAADIASQIEEDDPNNEY